MESALIGSRLNAALASAPALAEDLRRQLDGQGSTLPSFSALAMAVGVPATRTATPLAQDRLPFRVVSALASDTEKALLKTYMDTGLHELLSIEMVDALADHIRAA